MDYLWVNLGSAAAVNKISVDEFKAVSAESWITPIIKPTATTCIATSLGILNKLHAKGMSKSDPPATPEAPQALIEPTTAKSSTETNLNA